MSLTILCEEEAFVVGLVLSEARLELILRGFWDVPTVARLGAALRSAKEALANAGFGGGAYVTLVDNSAFQVQGREVIEALSRLVIDERPPRRIAAVVTSALLRRQAQRVGPDHSLFGTRAEALAWLEGE
jgi:hypothetical protein